MKIPERLPKSIDGLVDLCQYVAEILPRLRMVEIGCWTGAGTQIFSRYFDQVIAIDPWSSEQGEIAGEYNIKEVENIFDSRRVAMPNVIKCKATSLDAVNDFKDRSFNMVYIDALHEYSSIKADIAAWNHKICKGGILAGHDYSRRFLGVIKAVNELEKPIRLFKDTSWAIQL